MSLHRQRFYGFFRCENCNKSWESSHVYEKDGEGVYWKQKCKECQSAWAPYKAEPLVCRHCGNQKCTCSATEKAKRHTDPKKPHRAELCTKCQAGLPCEG